MPQKIKELQDQLERIIKGKKDITDKILMAVLAKGHVLLEDVPGVGKTTTALALSRLMGMEFNRIQFTPDVVPSDVTGFTMYDKQSGQFSYRAGAVMCNLLLADEINRTSSKTQSALLEVMEEGKVTVDGETHGVPGSPEPGGTVKGQTEGKSPGKCKDRSHPGGGAETPETGTGDLCGRPGA